jgi:hypothetical protein
MSTALKLQSPAASFDVAPGGRTIRGTIIRCVDGRWSDRDGVAFPDNTLMLAIGTTMVLQHWKSEELLEEVPHEGKTVPELKARIKALNAAIPQEQWDVGLNGPTAARWQWRAPMPSPDRSRARPRLPECPCGKIRPVIRP